MSQTSPVGTFNGYERLFWGVLSALARHGYVAPADEGKDLIHDFFLDAWDGLLGRFDAGKGDFEDYLASAFYKFARRRIVTLQDWRYRLVDIEAAAELESPGKTPAQSAEAGQLLAAVTQALNRLPPLERQALYEYVQAEDGSERAVARKLGLSRYALREILTNALGRLAVSLRQVVQPETVESRVAACLWEEARSVRSTAAHLGMTVQQVTDAKERYVLDLLTALRHTNNQSSSGNKTMPYEILLQAIRSPGDQARLEQVRRHAATILSELEFVDDPLEYGPVSHSEEGRRWIAQVYATLAGAGGGDDAEPSPIARAMEAMRTSEEQEIGAAFAQLCDGLPRLASWHDYFGHLPRADDELKQFLRHDESVEASGAYGWQLLDIGLTPSMFFSATRALQLMFDRTCRALGGRADDTALRHWQALGEPAVHLHVDSRHVGIPEKVLGQQLAGVQHLPAAGAWPMAHWTLDALADRPYMVAGYEYAADSRVFRPCADRWGDSPLALMARWSARQH